MEENLFNFIPSGLCTYFATDAITELNLIYLGREALLALSQAWLNRTEELFRRSKAADSTELRILIASDAQECRKKGYYLRNLSYRADSKPQIFRQEHFRVGERVTCFFQQPPRYIRILIGERPFANLVVTGVSGSQKSPLYRLNPRKDGVVNPNGFYFKPDRVSIFPTDDFSYLKCHPNFFRMYLSFRARTEPELQKIGRVLSAL